MYELSGCEMVLPDSKKIRKKEANLSESTVETEYIIKEIRTEDQELEKFLFTLGCYPGEKIVVLSILGENYVVSLKDARYSIDKDLAEAIKI
jgi:Fe2+ transport system protein FeoA